MILLEPDEARVRLVAHHRLRRPFGAGLAAVPALLEAMRCIQLDPLDRIGTNADLVVLARVDGLRRGDVWRAVYPGHAFEHFAKERCLLPASRFPYWRDQAVQTPWWRLEERLKRVSGDVIDRVLAEVEARGPLTARDLDDHGAVEAIDWSGWKGTSKAATMALEVLWTRCQVVVCGRVGRSYRYDVPRRALADHWERPSERPFADQALLDRVDAAGMLPRASGPQWSMLKEIRTSPRIDELLADGELVEVGLPGTTRRWLCRPAFLASPTDDDDDGRMRILGPLDPLIWDRELVARAFGFTYVWEVYKPAEQRRWGWYVVPLLHQGRLVGRLEAHVDGALVVDRVWLEHPDFDDDALRAALHRHSAAVADGAVQGF